MSTIRIGTVEEKPLQASKWMQIQMLVEKEELEDLFSTLGDIKIYRTGCVLNREEGNVTLQEFLDCYQSYLSSLKEGKIPPENLYTSLFSSILTKSTDCLFALPVGDNQQIIRVSKPIVQMQSHQMGYSSSDGKFHSMTFGIDSILWGIQFSYPQLHQNALTYQIENTLDTPGLPNTEIFRQIQSWTRRNTIPTPFIVYHHKINVPIRIGKGCLAWINQHPQLSKKGITVA